ncbi:MAG: DNA-binding protein [Bryobacteraceae bacterium]|jgi:hypothetical protein
MASKTVAKRYLTEIEVEEEYSLGRRYLRLRRLHGGGPPWIKPIGSLGQKGGRILYPREALEAWLASRPGGGETAPAADHRGQFA